MLRKVIVYVILKYIGMINWLIFFLCCKMFLYICEFKYYVWKKGNNISGFVIISILVMCMCSFFYENKYEWFRNMFLYWSIIYYKY